MEELRFGELEVAERLKLLWHFLDIIKQNPHFTVREVLKEFKSRYGLTEWTVRRFADILWFGDLIRIERRGVYVPFFGTVIRTFYVLTDLGEKYHKIGTTRDFTLKDFKRILPGWTYRALARKPKPKPKVPLNTAYFKSMDFEFWIQEDWNYKVWVETPESWRGKGYEEIPPEYLEERGIDRGNTGLPYSVKHRTIILLNIVKIFKKEVGGQVMEVNFFSLKDGYCWLPLTPEYAMNRPVPTGRKTPRTMIYDPKGKVKVSEVHPSPAGRRRWVVDFKEYSQYAPRVAPIKDMIEKFQERKKKEPSFAKLVTGVWEK